MFFSIFNEVYVFIFYICIENVNVCLYLYHRIGLKIHFRIRNPNQFRPVFWWRKNFQSFCQNKNDTRNYLTHRARDIKEQELRKNNYFWMHFYGLYLWNNSESKNHFVPDSTMLSLSLTTTPLKSFEISKQMTTNKLILYSGHL